MRKESHIRMARFIVANSNCNELYEHRRSFYWGSILPDCTPTFFTIKHNYATSFTLVQKKIFRLIQSASTTDKLSYRNFSRRMGIIIHYIADYFTHPHNPNFSGHLPAHCYYEAVLARRLKKHLKSSAAVARVSGLPHLKSAEEIIQYITRRHNEYLQTVPSLENDCRFITDLCVTVSEAILRLKAGAEAGVPLAYAG